MRFSRLAVLVLGMAAMAAAQNSTWSYEGRNGPLRWSKLDPSYQACSSGHEQSPIDIRGAHLNKALQPIEFHYMAGSITLENDGHTIVGRVNPGSYIVADGVRYDLVQFHFHHPGELHLWLNRFGGLGACQLQIPGRLVRFDGRQHPPERQQCAPGFPG